jgi:hypothetical protein
VFALAALSIAVEKTKGAVFFVLKWTFPIWWPVAANLLCKWVLDEDIVSLVGRTAKDVVLWAQKDQPL